MTFQEFIDQVKEYVSAQLGESCTVCVQTVQKNNGVLLDALYLTSPGRNTSPLIYLNPYYHRYLNGVKTEEICEEICEICRSHLPAGNVDVSFFFDYEKVRPRLIPKLINYEKNESLLREVVHVRFLDLAVVFLCTLQNQNDLPGSEGGRYAAILLRNHHAAFWQKSAEDLFRDAVKNSPLLLPPELHRITDLLSEMAGSKSGVRKEDDLLFDPSACLTAGEEETDPPMYVLTNRQRINGASVILYENLLPQIAARFGKNLLILPSSIHELILLPVDEETPCAYVSFLDIVQEVNETQVADEEVLSDQAYFYRARDQKLSVITK